MLNKNGHGLQKDETDTCESRRLYLPHDADFVYVLGFIRIRI